MFGLFYDYCSNYFRVIYFAQISMPSNRPKSVSWFWKKVQDEKRMKDRPQSAFELTKKQEIEIDARRNIKATIKKELRNQNSIRPCYIEKIGDKNQGKFKKLCQKFSIGEIGKKRAVSTEHGQVPMEKVVQAYLLNKEIAEKKLKKKQKQTQVYWEKQINSRTDGNPKKHSFFDFSKDLEPFQKSHTAKIQRTYDNDHQRTQAYQKFRKSHPFFQITQQGRLQAFAEFQKNDNFYIAISENKTGFNQINLIQPPTPLIKFKSSLLAKSKASTELTSSTYANSESHPLKLKNFRRKNFSRNFSDISSTASVGKATGQ